ncbi:MAG TPA: maltotransferase domain-containing protein, partial [Microbacterium sp.]|nr:maltotransferase domain-containing protein [Microbacterium sp.]
MAARTVSRSEALRSPAQIPLRSAPATATPDSTRVGRIPLADPRPFVPGGFDAKAFAGEVVPFSVIAFREGHDRIGVHVRLAGPDGSETLHRLEPLDDGTDRWTVDIALDARGLWRYRFEAFADDYATWAHAAAVKIDAGVDVEVMTASGAQLFARAAAEKDRPAAERRRLAAVASDLG